MKHIAVIIILLILAGWMLGVFIYSLMGLIHLLIFFAVVTLLLGIKRKA